MIALHKSINADWLKVTARGKVIKNANFLNIT